MYLHLLQMIWGGNTKLVNSNWRKWRKMRRRIKVFTVIAFLFWAKFLVFTVIRSILSLYWFPSHHSSECLFVFQWISLVKADCIVPWSLLRRCWWPHTLFFTLFSGKRLLSIASALFYWLPAWQEVTDLHTQQIRVDVKMFWFFFQECKILEFRHLKWRIPLL